jgi:hypothetical protein
MQKNRRRHDDCQSEPFANGMMADFETDEAKAFGMDPYCGLQKKKRGKNCDNHVCLVRKRTRHTGMTELAFSMEMAHRKSDFGHGSQMITPRKVARQSALSVPLVSIKFYLIS